MIGISSSARAIIEGHHHDPFNYLGWHHEGDEPVVRVFLPEAIEVKVVDDAGHVSELPRIHDAGLFAGPVAARDPHYRLRARFGDSEVELEDAYRFPPILTDMDLHLLGEGTHLELYDKLGAHPMRLDGVDGVAFVVFAPNARRVSVVGDFNLLGRPAPRHAGARQRLLGDFRAGRARRRQIQIRDRRRRRPVAAAQGRSGGFRRRAAALDRVDRGRCRASCRGRCGCEHSANALAAPMSIYEVHLGSWRRKPEEGGRWLTYRELAEQLPAYAADMGFTHIELMPVVGASVRRLVGLSADRPVRADQPLRHRRPISRAGRRLPSQGHRRAARLGAGPFPRRSARARRNSTAPRSTSTPTRCRAAISTGTR